MDLLYKYKEQCENSIKPFKEKVFGDKTLWVSCGILMSEGFSVCAAIDLYNINMLIESGIYNGHSTQIWANYSETIQIKAFDIKLKEATKNRLSAAKNISMERGDSRVLIPKLLTDNKDKKIGVFIDGPKALEALKLAEECYRYDNVAFVAIHDLSIAYGQRVECEKMIDRLKAKSFFTDEGWFVDSYKDLDLNETHQHDAGDTWMPYKRIYKNGVVRNFGGSYGWTVGILLKNF